MINASDVKERIQASTLCSFWNMITPIIIKITISSIVIGLKISYFTLIYLPSCYRTVPWASHIQNWSLNHLNSPFCKFSFKTSNFKLQRPNWTPLSPVTITYCEKFQINYCWNRVLTVLKVLVCLNSARMPLRLISVCQEIISSFLSHRSIFPRFDSIPVRKLKICCSLKTYCHSGKWIYSQSRKS